MADQLAVTADSISRAADAADAAAADIRKKSQNIVSDMMGRSAQFQGGAGTAFRNVLTKFAEELNRDVLTKLEDLANKTRQSTNTTLSQDEAGAAELTSAGNQFGNGGRVTAGLS